MSNSNLYGSMDRRKRLPAANVRAGERFEKVFRQFDYDERPGAKGKDETRAALEMAATRSALRDLEPADRAVIDSDIEKLKIWCGAGFGDVAALQILARLGIWLTEAGVREQ